MDQIERLLGLYKGAQTDSERRILLEAAQISNPGDFPRLEDMILRDQVRGMTIDQLVQMIASHRSITLEQADELLRDAVFENLIDRPSLKVAVSARAAPALESRSAPGAASSCTAPSPVAPAPRKNGTASPPSRHPPQEAAEVIILQNPSEPESVPIVIGNVKPEGGQNQGPSPSSAATSFGRFQPRGIGG